MSHFMASANAPKLIYHGATPQATLNKLIVLPQTP